MWCNMLANLPAVKTYSRFSLLAKLLVAAPWLPVQSLAEEAQHADTLCEQMARL